MATLPLRAQELPLAVRQHRRLAIAVVLAAEIATLVGIVLVGRLFFDDWINLDVEVYVEAGRRFAAGQGLYDWAAPGGWTFRYSPAFAALMAPLSGVPFEVASVAFRLLGLTALAWSLRGLGWLIPIVLLSPGVVFDQVPGNVMSYALAAMVAVLRRPGVAAVTLYALLILLVPKPVFLPVLLWGLVRVPRALVPVGAIATAGAAMLLLDHAFADGLLKASWEWGHTLVPGLVLPAWLVVASLVAGAACAIAALRSWRFLAPASVLTSPYFYGYAFAPLILLALPDDTVAERAEATPRVP